MNKEIPIIKDKSYDEVVGRISLPEEMAKQIAEMGKEFGCVVMLSPVILLKPDGSELISFNLKFEAIPRTTQKIEEAS